jgi:hypothetical protein
MKRLAKDAGYEIVSDELVQIDTKDFKVNASKVVKAKADAVFIATGYTTQAFILMKDLYERKYQGMRITFIDVDAKYLRDYGQSAEGTYAPGIAPNKFSKSFSDKYESMYGKKVEDYLPPLGYDMLRLSLGAFQSKGNKDLVTSAITYNYKDSAMGNFRYLSDRTVSFDMQLWKALNKNYVPAN